MAEIPISLQAKFLRAIQEREVTPLGSSRPVPVSVRIIAATNRDLEAEVAATRFRPDLFYRLNVVRITLPSLRDRRDDIPALVDHFLDRFSRQYQVAPKRVAPETMERLLAHDWPGNIRELENAIERAFAVSAADTITLADLPAAVGGVAAPRTDDEVTPPEVVSLAEGERRVIAAALRQSQGNKNEAARLLGIDRQRLYRKIEKYRLG